MFWNIGNYNVFWDINNWGSVLGVDSWGVCISLRVCKCMYVLESISVDVCVLRRMSGCVRLGE